MKLIKTLCLAGTFLCCASLLGQDQLFFIHEDNVKPSQVEKYSQTSMELAKVLRAANLPDLVAHAHRLDNDVFIWASPIDNMADLDKNPWDDLKEKIGEEKFDALFDGYNGTYSSHRSYLVKYRAESSYIPEGSDWGEDILYRRWDYNWVDPDMAEEAMEITKEWVQLHQSKGVTSGYRIYTGGLGTDVPLIVVYRWAKDPVDMASKMAAASTKMGDASKALWDKTSKMLVKTETYTGWYMPDISYVPPVEPSASK